MGAAGPGTERHLRLAFVGCGAIARWHLAAVRAAARRTEVTVAVDVDRERAVAISKETGAEPFGSVDEALSVGTFDAALIMVPHRRHEELALAMLGAGKHVLLEKPMAPSLDACDRIVAAAQRSGSVFLVAENAQYWPEVVRTKALIDDGAVGEVFTARAWHCAPPMEQFAGPGNWRFSVAEAGGGVAIDAGSHWLRPLRIWLGELVEVVAATGRPYGAMEGESMCRALCRFDSGVVASFDAVLSPGPVAPLPLFQVTGTRGELVIDVLGRVKLYDGSDPRGAVVGQGGYLQSYEHQMAAFEAAVLDGVSPTVGAEYSLGELRAALAMYRSAVSGRWEAVW
ncbi:MAG TPA: Gfo/Idh/MocA family oxidoreductase [Acidimicrobiales bacterium]|nr:Gfo/Idh/MocA family oxidoreductase [Acidimicrobiales bacterium]